MLLKIQTSLLMDCFTKAYSIIERRSSIPVLSHVLIIAGQEKVTIRTTDLDHSFEGTVEAEVSKQGSVLVQAQTFYEIIKKSGSEILTLELINEELVVKSSNAQFKLTTLNSEEFPEFQDIDNEKSFSISAEKFKKLLDLTYFSMSIDETRANLHGVYLHNSNADRICAVATDAHRLALAESDDIKNLNSQKLNMVLSKKTVLEYRKLLDNNTGTVKISFNAVYISLKFGNIKFQSRLVDGTFPEYSHIIPKDMNSNFITVNRKVFLDVISRISIVADEKTPLVKFKIFDQKLIISSISSNKGEAEETISVCYNGVECNLGFNPRYITDVANNLESSDINIHFKDSASAIVIKEAGNDLATFMIMPMLVN